MLCVLVQLMSEPEVSERDCWEGTREGHGEAAVEGEGEEGDEYRGIYERFQTISFQKSDDIALFGHLYDQEHEEDREEEEEEYNEITYIELQLISEQLSLQLLYRYHLQPGNTILLLCHNAPIAEVISCLTCIQLQCPFIPIDIHWLHSSTDKLHDIIQDCQPSVALVVAESESHESERSESESREIRNQSLQILAKCGIHKCVLLQKDGNIISNDSWSSLLTGSVPVTRRRRDESIPLYILYTSGSTGKPKGVLGTERGLLNRIQWQAKRFPWLNPIFDPYAPHSPSSSASCDEQCEEEEEEEEEEDVVCRRTPLVFVDSLAEIFGSLLSGIKIWVPSREVSGNSDGRGMNQSSNRSLMNICNKGPAAKVSHLTLLPSQLFQLLSHLMDSHTTATEPTWPSLRLVFVSGESCSLDTVHLFRLCVEKGIIPNAILVNLYGSTEVSGDVTASRLCWKDPKTKSILLCPTVLSAEEEKVKVATASEREKEARRRGPYVPIGEEIIDGNWLYVVRDSPTGLTLVQWCGEEGELLIGGVHVATGYLNNPQSPKFLINPFPHLCSLSPNQCPLCQFPILFRTGDLVKLHPSTESSSLELKFPLHSCDGHFVEYLGRKDLQVKVSGGIRIHLEEVEDCLRGKFGRQFPLSDDSPPLTPPRAVAISPSDSKRKNVEDSSSSILVLFLCSDLLASCRIPLELHSSPFLSRNLQSSTMTSSSLIQLTSLIREILTSTPHTIPSFFLPSLVIPIESIPLTEATGKLNRPILLQLAEKIYSQINSATPSSWVVPENSFHEEEGSPEEISSFLISLYRGILPLDPGPFLSSLRIDNFGYRSPRTSFAALGGDSMSSIEVLWKISKKFPGVKVSRDQLMSLSLFELSTWIAVSLRTQHNESLVEVDTGAKKRSLTEEGQAAPLNDLKKTRNHDWLSFPSNSTQREISVLPTDSFENSISYHWRSRGVCGNYPLISPPTTSAVCPPSFSLSLSWSCQLSRCIDTTPLFITSSPSLIFPSHQRCYVGSHGGDVTCVNLSTHPSSAGNIIWSKFLGVNLHFESEFICDPGMRLRADFPQDKNFSHSCSYPLYLSSYLGVDRDPNPQPNKELQVDPLSAKGQIWCLDSSDGEVIWHSGDLIKDEVKGSPTLFWIAQYPVLVSGSHGGQIYLFNALNGKIYCHYDASGNGSIFASIIACPPFPSSISPCLCIATTKGSIYCLSLIENFDPFGALKDITVSMKWQSFSVANSPIFGTPVLLNSSFNSSPLLVFGTVGGTMECVSILDGTPVWRYDAIPHHLNRSPFFSPPCLVTTSLGSSSNFLVIGSHDGWVRFVDPMTGILRSEVNVGAVIYGSLTWMKRGGKEIIVACTTAGDVCVLELVASEDWTLRSRFVLSGEIYASPTIVDTHDLQGVLVGCRDDCVHYLSLSN